VWAVHDLKLPVARTLQAPSQDELGSHVEWSAKEFPKTSTAREHPDHPPRQGEAPAAPDSLEDGPGGLTLDTARSPVAMSNTWFGVELDKRRGSDFPDVAAPELAFDEDVTTARQRRKGLLALVGAGLLLATGFGGYWYSTSPISRPLSGVLAQPAQPHLDVQAPPPQSPPPSQTDTKGSAPGASANVVSPKSEGKPARAQNPVPGQTAVRFVLQMATLQSPERAERALQELRDAGYRGYRSEVFLQDGTRALAVFLGPYAELASAEQDLARARQIPGYDTARVVQRGASVLPPRPQP